MSTPLWRQIIEGTYDPFSSSFDRRSSAGTGFEALNTDWRAFQMEQDAQSAAQRQLEQEERAALEARGDEYVNLEQAQARLGTALDTASAFGQPGIEPSAPATALEGIASVLDRAKSGVVGGISGLLGWDIEGDDPEETRLGMSRFTRREDIVGDRNRIQVAWERALRGFFGGQSYGFGDFEALRYDQDDPRFERVTKGLGAFILDTAFDPLTYYSFGSSVLGRIVTSTGVRQVSRTLGREALEAAGEQAIRDQVERLGARELATRVSTSSGKKFEELIVRSPQQLTDDLLAASRDDFLEAAVDSWSFGNAAAYGARGRTGFYDRLVQTVGQDIADDVWQKIPLDVRGGARIRVPFARTRDTATGLRLPTILAFPGSQPGRGFDKLGMGNVVRRMNQARLVARTGPFKFVENVSGGKGRSWTKVLQAARNGDGEAIEAYAIHFGTMAFDDAYRLQAAAYDQMVGAGMEAIGRQISAATDQGLDQDEIIDFARELYFKRGRSDVPTPSSPAHVVAADIVSHMFEMTDNVHKMAVEIYGEDAARKMQDYATRMLTDDGFKDLVERYGRLEGRRGSLSEGDGRLITSYPKRMEIDAQGRLIVTEWMTPDEIFKETGQNLFISDPIEAVGEYLIMMRRELMRDWSLKKLDELGLLKSIGEDVIRQPTIRKIQSEVGPRLAKIKDMLARIEKGEPLDELEQVALEADRAAVQTIQASGQLLEVEPGVWRSSDGMVEVRRNRSGGYSASVAGEPVLRPTVSQAQAEELVPELQGPAREVNWDEVRRGFYDEDGNRIPARQVRMEGVDDPRWVTSEPPPSAVRRLGRAARVVAEPDDSRELSGTWKPWMDSGSDADLEYVHKVLRHRVSTYENGGRSVSRQAYNVYKRDLEILEELHPHLRGMQYDDVPTPASSSLPEQRYAIEADERGNWKIVDRQQQPRPTPSAPPPPATQTLEDLTEDVVSNVSGWEKFGSGAQQRHMAYWSDDTGLWSIEITPIVEGEERITKSTKYRVRVSGPGVQDVDAEEVSGPISKARSQAIEEVAPVVIFNARQAAREAPEKLDPFRYQISLDMRDDIIEGINSAVDESWSLDLAETSPGIWTGEFAGVPIEVRQSKRNEGWREGLWLIRIDDSVSSGDMTLEETVDGIKRQFKIWAKNRIGMMGDDPNAPVPEFVARLNVDAGLTPKQRALGLEAVAWQFFGNVFNPREMRPESVEQMLESVRNVGAFLREGFDESDQEQYVEGLSLVADIIDEFSTRYYQKISPDRMEDFNSLVNKVYNELRAEIDDLGIMPEGFNLPPQLQQRRVAEARAGVAESYRPGDEVVGRLYDDVRQNMDAYLETGDASFLERALEEVDIIARLQGDPYAAYMTTENLSPTLYAAATGRNSDSLLRSFVNIVRQTAELHELKRTLRIGVENPKVLGEAAPTVPTPTTPSVPTVAPTPAPIVPGLRREFAGRYKYTRESGEQFDIEQVRPDGGAQVWRITDAEGVDLGDFPRREDAVAFLEGRPPAPPRQTMPPETRAFVAQIRQTIREMAAKGIEADDWDDMTAFLLNAVEILAFDQPALARRLAVTFAEDVGAPDVATVLSDVIEDVVAKAPAPRPTPTGGTQQAAGVSPGVGGAGTVLTPPTPRPDFIDRDEAAYWANRFANKIRAPRARVIRDEVWERNREELVKRLQEDESWLEAALEDGRLLQNMDEESFETWVERVTSFLQGVDPSIDPFDKAVDKRRYSRAAAEAGIERFRTAGIDPVVAAIIRDNDLFGPEILGDTIKRHFALSRDLDGAERFYQNFWRPYYTASKSWMTQGRGYGYTARNIIGSMYNAWLADVRARHFKYSGALLAARRNAREKADEILERRGVQEGETTVEAWERVFDTELRRFLREGVGGFNGLRDDVADFVADAYQLFTDRNYGGRTARSRTWGDILDRGEFDSPVYETPIEGGRRAAELFPGRTLDELTRAQRIANASIDNPWMRHVTRVNESTEDYLRFAAFLRGADTYGLEDGGFAAGTWVVGTQFDYSNLSEFERRVMKNIVPFYTWTRYNVPLQIRSVWMEPGKVNRLLRFHEEVMKAWTGESQEDEQSLPEWLRRRGGWMTTMSTPMTDPESMLGQIFGLKEDPIAAYIESPLSDLGMLFNATLNPLQIANMDEIINNLNPIVGRTAYEFLTGRSYVSGRELDSDAPAPRWAVPFAWVRDRRNDDGELVFSQKWAQTFRNLLPPFAQAERLLAPLLGDERQRRRWLTTVGSQVLATPLYTVDPNQQAFAITTYAQGIQDALDDGIIGYEDRRDVARRLLDMGYEPEQIRELGLSEADPTTFNFEELARARRNVVAEDQIASFLETLPPDTAEIFIFRRGFRGKTGVEAVEAWKNRAPINELGALYMPEVDVAFADWFGRLSESDKLGFVFRYGYGPYRGAEAVQQWSSRGGLPNRPAGMGSADFLADGP